MGEANKEIPFELRRGELSHTVSSLRQLDKESCSQRDWRLFIVFQSMRLQDNSQVEHVQV